jgi:hypothetical protein
MPVLSERRNIVVSPTKRTAVRATPSTVPNHFLGSALLRLRLFGTDSVGNSSVQQSRDRATGSTDSRSETT